MTVKRKHTTFKVPLTEAFHQVAQEFYHHHANPIKGKQIYLNTLSVQAVKFYLDCLGIESDLEKSESWHLVSQVIADIADLWVNDLGRLDCRPVLPEASMLEISPEAWGGDSPSEGQGQRIGYLFVQFNTALTEATLLGFLPPEAPLKIQHTPITLDQLQPLETFPDYLVGLRHSPIVSPTPVETSSMFASTRVRLQPWLDQVVDASWTSLETLIREWQSHNLALNFRGLSTRASWIEPATAGVKQGKFLRLSEVSETRILLAVGIMPAAHDALAADKAVFDITIEVYPTGDNVYLPSTLHMIVMDEANTPVLQAKGRQSEGLEFKFSGCSGECFSVHISCEQFTITELFEI